MTFLRKNYNDYKFAENILLHMFLNKLKNRLQSHAVPSVILNDVIEVATTTRNEANGI